MIHIDSTPIKAISGDKVDNGNGTISVKKANGKFLCITPEGNLEERDSPGGPWESFIISGQFLVAIRDWNNDNVTYLLGFVETK